jgi:hypothetical protein
MIERAFDSHCEVVRLLHPSPLDNLGHIGAELSEAAAAAQPSHRADTLPETEHQDAPKLGRERP